MRHYELLFVLRPTLTEEEAKAKVDFIKEVLEKNGATIGAKLDLGTRKLAYTVQKFKRGHYTVFYFEAPAAAIGEIERIIRINEEIIKFLTVKFENKTEIAYWEKSVAKIIGKAEKESKPETEVKPEAESKPEEVSEEA
ncbi:MAG: 30S ribosomal protein S6 [Campylobacteraceae bacterium]|jgi:small subunit ribosomal protein S6|nr:30S ribosomal protein S6 [Campylobacteraceae bacterium]